MCRLVRVSWKASDMTTVAFDQLDGVIWMNGQMVDWPDAKLHVLSHGLHYGSSVFEGERMYGGEIFKLTEHTQRLLHSAEIMGFKIGKKQQLGQIEKRWITGRARVLTPGSIRIRAHNIRRFCACWSHSGFYVSHVDLFWTDCY